MGRADPVPIFGLAPGGVCRAGPVARTAVRSYIKGLRPAPFHPYLGPLSVVSGPSKITRDGLPIKDHGPIGGIFSVALSRSLRTVAVSDHRALRSPDFPLTSPEARQRPSGRPCSIAIIRRAGGRCGSAPG